MPEPSPTRADAAAAVAMPATAPVATRALGTTGPVGAASTIPSAASRDSSAPVTPAGTAPVAPAGAAPVAPAAVAPVTPAGTAPVAPAGAAPVAPAAVAPVAPVAVAPRAAVASTLSTTAREERPVGESGVLHVVPGPARHGVTGHALALLARPAARGHGVARIAVDELDPTSVEREFAALPPAALTHVHLTDHLLAPSASACADVVVALARRRRVSLALHDLPQPGEGAGRHERRRGAYARMAAAAVGVVVPSEHERDLLQGALVAEVLRAGGPVEVVPLPIDRAAVQPGAGTPPEPRSATADDDAAAPTGSVGAGGAGISATDGPADEAVGPPAGRGRDVGVFGYVYPGKGHVEAIEATEGLPADVGVVALGSASAGHAHLLEEYAALARRAGRRFEATGYLADVDVLGALRTVAVPVAPHRHVSASGSIGTWLWAGRRPLVPAGRYAEELERRCPGALVLYGPGRRPADLAGAVAAALADPSLTWLDPAVRLVPTADGAAARTVALLDAWARSASPEAETVPGTTAGGGR